MIAPHKRDKMKVLAIGDIHGKDIWKQVDISKYDKIVFLGDYVDAYDKTDDEIISNLQEILELKKQYLDKVVLLLGNHDNSYLHKDDYTYGCSGFRPSICNQLQDIFKNNLEYLTHAYQIQNYLFTHAGISNTWYTKHLAITVDSWKERGVDMGGVLADSINALAKTTDHTTLAMVSRIRGGDHHIGGIYWADIDETSNDFLNGYNQIVGHNRVSDIITESNTNSSITYCDCLDTIDKFYEIEIEEKI